MTNASLERRIERLENESDAGEVTLEEALRWTYAPKEERTTDNPEYVDYCRRFERSALGRGLLEVVQKNAKRATEPPG